jgi:type IV pilus assembly protein PilX
LFVVIVFVMLSMLLALWASRTALFNEMVVGNDADYQRALEAAQALLQDAELDIRGERADGSTCTGTSPVCRSGAGIAQIPLEAKEVSALLADLEGMPTTDPQCNHALCAKRTGKQDFWNDPTALLAMMKNTMSSPTGARYGQYTGAQLGNTTNPANPILAMQTNANEGGWYWIEVLPYDAGAGNSALIAGGSSHLALNLDPNVAYRITAVAHGRKANTQAVLQQTYVRQKLKD